MNTENNESETAAPKQEWFTHITGHNGYDSKFEAEIAKQLEAIGLEIRREPRLTYGLPGEDEVRTYRPDWVVKTGWGPVYIEAKGYLDVKAKAKMEAVRRAHPNKEIWIVFQDGSTKPGGYKKGTSLLWASRTGFKAAEKTIPDDWIRVLNHV